MGSSLKHAVQLLNALNQASDMTLTLGAIKQQLSLSPDEVNLIVDSINGIEPLFKLEDERLAMLRPVEVLNEDYLFNHLQGPGRITVIDEIDSTNQEMIRCAANLASGDTLAAEIQSAGRGRRGSRWHTTIGRQLTFSTCHAFKDLDALQGLSIAAGIACAQALEPFLKEKVMLKWPNDLYVNHRKLGGILIESVPCAHNLMAVIGVGINVFKDKTMDTADIRPAIAMEECASEKPDRNAVCIALVNQLRRTLGIFERDGLTTLLIEWQKRDYLKGMLLNIEEGEGSAAVSGVASGINAQGELLITTDTGDTLSLNKGHIALMSRI